MPRTPTAVIDPLLAISANLRPRDYVLAHLLQEHDIMSTEQIKAIFFTSLLTCSHRLDELRRMRFIASSIINCADGSRRKFWLPGLLSTRYVSIATQESEPTRKALQERQARAVIRRDRDDIVAANSFFIDLIAQSRAHSDSRLARWWSPDLTRTAIQGLVWPDGCGVHPQGHGVWIEDGREVRFFLEHDAGAEPIWKLMERIERHRQLRFEGGPNYPVLIWLPTATREAELHEQLRQAQFGLTLADLTVATTARDAGLGPASAAWWVTTTADRATRESGGSQRYRLGELTSDGGLSDDGPPLLDDPAEFDVREPWKVSGPLTLFRVLRRPLTVRQDPLHLPKPTR